MSTQHNDRNYWTSLEQLRAAATLNLAHLDNPGDDLEIELFRPIHASP